MWIQIKRQALDESPLLQSSPFALKLEIKKKAELLLERCIAVSNGLSIARCLSCPKVAVLYEAYCNLPHAVLKKCSLLSPETLQELGADTALPRKVIAEVVALIKAEVETRRTRCESDLMSRIDSFLEGTGVSISRKQAEELVGRTPQSKEYIEYVSGFLTMASGLVAFSAKLKDKPTAEISQTCDDIKAVQKSLEAYKEKAGLEGVHELLGAKRLSAMEECMASKVKDFELLLVLSLEPMLQDIQKCSAALVRDIGKIPLQDEAKLISAMRSASGKLVGSQKELEKMLNKAAKAFASMDRTAEFESSMAHMDGHQAIGLSHFVVCLFTSVTLYRSPFFGKKNDQGAKVKDGSPIIVLSFAKSMCLLIVFVGLWPCRPCCLPVDPISSSLNLSCRCTYIHMKQACTPIQVFICTYAHSQDIDAPI